MEKRHRAASVLPFTFERLCFIPLSVSRSAAPAAVSRPERSDRVSEEAQFPRHLQDGHRTR